MTQETVQYTVHIHPDPDGLWAEVLELPGCFAAGDTLEELYGSLSESIGLYLSEDDRTVTARVIDADGDVIEERREFQLCDA